MEGGTKSNARYTAAALWAKHWPAVDTLDVQATAPLSLPCVANDSEK